MATQALPVPAAPRLRVGHSAGYVLTGFPLAVAAFVLLVAGFAVGIGTLAITIGVFVLAGTLAAARTLARVERFRLDALLGVRTPRPAYRTPRGGRLGRAVSAGADPRRWLDLLHGIIAFPVAVATFAIVVAWFAAAIGGLGYVLWEWSLPRGDDRPRRRRRAHPALGRPRLRRRTGRAGLGPAGRPRRRLSATMTRCPRATPSGWPPSACTPRSAAGR